MRTIALLAALFSLCFDAAAQSVTATPKTKAELLHGFRDGQAKNAITPRSMRDFVASAIIGQIAPDNTSATAGIQTAIDAAAPNGTVVLSCGTYTITQTIRVQTTASQTRRIAIRGVDRSCAVIKASAAFPSGEPMILFSDNDPGTNKYETGQYGLSELTLDGRLATNSDILQVGTDTDAGVAHGMMFHHLSFWGGKRWVYSRTGGKVWLTNSYFSKDDADNDGILLDVTDPADGPHRGAWSLADLEIGTHAASPGAGNAISIVCSHAVICGYTLIDNVNALGAWHNALRVENTVAHTGMYVVVDRFVSEIYAGEATVVFKKANFNQIRNSWISNFTTTGSAPAMILDTSHENIVNNNYFYSSAGGPEVYITGGGRHLWDGNRFFGATKAFGFDAGAAPVESTVGFNHYNALVHNQQSLWNSYVLTGTNNNSVPEISRFKMSPTYVKVSESGADNVLVLENSDGGTVNGRKWFTVDSLGTLRILDHAGTSVNFYSADSGDAIIRGTLQISNSDSFIKFGTGDPNGAVTANRGSVFFRTDGGANTSMYIKESGDATNTGWIAK